MPDLTHVWKYISIQWRTVGPLLWIAVGFLVRWLFDQLSEHLAARREYRQKITELMIPKLHEYAEKYYVPVGSLASGAAARLRAMLASPANVSNDQLGHMMFNLGRFFGKEVERSRAIGGFFFQDLTGEALASALQSNLNAIWSSSQFVGTQQRVSLREEAEKAGSIAIFLHELDSNQGPLRDALRQWLKSEEAPALCDRLEVYSKLLLSEVNWAYEYWYRQKHQPVFSAAQTTMLKNLLDKLEQRGEISAARKRNYLRKLRVKVDP